MKNLTAVIFDAEIKFPLNGKTNRSIKTFDNTQNEQKSIIYLHCGPAELWCLAIDNKRYINEIYFERFKDERFYDHTNCKTSEISYPSMSLRLENFTTQY